MVSITKAGLNGIPPLPPNEILTKYGSKLVQSCIENKSHYCDLAGEVQWIHKMIQENHESAKTNKVKIVNCCGFDSLQKF